MSTVQTVVDKNLSIRGVARSMGISKSVLARYVKLYRDSDDGTSLRMTPNYGHGTVFTLKQENELAEYCTRSSQMFFGLTPKRLRIFAYEMAKVNNIPVPQTWESTGMAGGDWLGGFLSRHRELSIRQPEATSLARATAFNKTNVDAFFNNLEHVIRKYGVLGKDIYNLDETGCTTVQKVPKVIGLRGEKQVGQITSRERGELVTMCAIVSATGINLPPVFVFPRKTFRAVLLSGAPEGSLGLTSDSGWMRSDIFVKVLEHVVTYAHASVENPILLTMDNHESHVSLQAILYARSKGIHIVTLPPHTSQKTQPLDRSVFGPFKAQYNSQCDSWMMRNPGKQLTIYQTAELAGIALTSAATPANIQAGFKASGIWPFDKCVFSETDFLPSNLTDHTYSSQAAAGQPPTAPATTPSGQPPTAPATTPSGQPPTAPAATPSGQPPTAPAATPSGQPPTAPAATPSGQPPTAPAATPSGQPPTAPAATPSWQPPTAPAATPSGQPPTAPAATPSGQPSTAPAATPSGQPSTAPAATPSGQPPSSQAVTSDWESSTAPAIAIDPPAVRAVAVPGQPCIATAVEASSCTMTTGFPLVKPADFRSYPKVKLCLDFIWKI